MTNAATAVPNPNQVPDAQLVFNDPDEERFNDLMTEANWEILKKMLNKPRLVVDNTVDAGTAATPQQLTDLRIKLLGNGYHPVPVIEAHIDTPSAGKRPTMQAWQTKCSTADQEEVAKYGRCHSATAPTLASFAARSLALTSTCLTKPCPPSWLPAQCNRSGRHHCFGPAGRRRQCWSIASRSLTRSFRRLT